MSFIDTDPVNNPSNSLAGWWLVSTVLQTSDDGGATWGGDTPINVAQTYPNGFAVNYEVAALVYDDGESDANQKWKIVYLCVVLSKSLGAPWSDATKSSLLMRTAPSATGPWSAPTTLLAGSLYNQANPQNPGAPLFTDSGALLVSEPGVVAHPTSGFYLAYSTITSGTPSTDYIQLSRIYKSGSVWTKTDIGTPLVSGDVTFFNALGTIFPANFPDWTTVARFDAPDLVKINDDYYFLFTPTTSGYAYRGMAVTRFSDISTATLDRDGSSNPILDIAIDISGPYHHGAGTYGKNAYSAGVTLSLYNPGIGAPFTIIQSGTNIGRASVDSATLSAGASTLSASFTASGGTATSSGTLSARAATMSAALSSASAATAAMSAQAATLSATLSGSSAASASLSARSASMSAAMLASSGVAASLSAGGATMAATMTVSDSPTETRVGGSGPATAPSPTAANNRAAAVATVMAFMQVVGPGL